MLAIIEKFLPTDRCSNLTSSLIGAEGWGAAKVGNPKRGQYSEGSEDRKVRDALVASGERSSNSISELEAVVHEAVCSGKFGDVQVDNLEFSGSQFVWYQKGGFYKVHADATYASRRVYTILIYLNDRFLGGETFFPGVNQKVEPRIGKAVLFPSTMLHSAEPVLNGEKIVFVSWYCRSYYPNWI